MRRVSSRWPNRRRAMVNSSLTLSLYSPLGFAASSSDSESEELSTLNFQLSTTLNSKLSTLTPPSFRDKPLRLC